ncbi:MAG: hypothetical protein WBN09_01455 [Woeseiaceae bacterium]
MSIAMLEGQGGLEVLYRFVLVFSVQAGGFFFGAFAVWRYPQERGLARWLLGLPFVFFLLPGLLKTAIGGRVTGGMLTLAILALVAAIMVASLVMPRRIANRLPAGLFRSRLFNGLILVGPLLGWLVFAGILLWVFGVEGTTSLRQARSSGTVSCIDCGSKARTLSGRGQLANAARSIKSVATVLLEDVVIQFDKFRIHPVHLAAR